MLTLTPLLRNCQTPPAANSVGLARASEQWRTPANVGDGPTNTPASWLTDRSSGIRLFKPFWANVACPRTPQKKLPEQQCLAYIPVTRNPIRHIIAIDGGFDDVSIQKRFPSSTVCFFQFGALTFSIADLDSLKEKPFINPEDIARLGHIQRLKFVLPSRNVVFKDQPSLTHSIRSAIYGFFASSADGECLMDTLRWLIFQEYGISQSEWGWRCNWGRL